MDSLNGSCPARSVGFTNSQVSSLIESILTAMCAISAPDIWPKDYGQTAITEGLNPYDFIVIGAGTAGSVVAARLSENPCHKVLLLEAGGDPPMESEIPAPLIIVQHTEYDWQYNTEPNGKSCLGMMNNSCYWPRGKVLGGTGALNGMLYVRGNSRDYNTWEELGNPTWDWNNVLKYYHKAENVKGRNPKSAYGTGGPFTIQEFIGESEIKENIIEAAEELGYKYVDVFYEGSYLGYNKVYGNHKDGRRLSTAKAYLTVAQNRSNLHIIKHAIVSKINFDSNKKVTSINFIYNNSKEMIAEVNKEVIVSAGSIDTSKLLMLSGIGPEKHLKKNEIPIVVDLPVGKNLQDHLLVPIVFAINDTKFPEIPESVTLDEIYYYLIHSAGPLANIQAIDLQSFMNVNNDSDTYPDIQNQHFLFRTKSSFLRTQFEISNYNNEIVESAIQANQNHSLIIVFVILTNPKSRGDIKLRSRNFRDKPVIRSNYLDDDYDLKTLLKGIRRQVEFERTKVFSKLNGKIIKLNIPDCDKFKFKSDDYWNCYTRHMATTIYHPVGTAKMGPNSDSGAVVDAELRVKGVKNLRVCDGSIMPLITSGNTNAPIVMIGEKCSDFIKQIWTC